VEPKYSSKSKRGNQCRDRESGQNAIDAAHQKDVGESEENPEMCRRWRKDSKTLPLKVAGGPATELLRERLEQDRNWGMRPTIGRMGGLLVKHRADGLDERRVIVDGSGPRAP
jgi:hypothetical protein